MVSLILSLFVKAENLVSLPRICCLKNSEITSNKEGPPYSEV